MDTINVDFKLSPIQISKLYQFAEKKFVHWYDLQIEIVDHLASSIEHEMQSDATITFELALQKVYKGFGIFGFAKIVQQKQVQLAKRAKMRWWNELICLLKWPRIVSLLLLVGVVATASLSFSEEILNIAFLIIYISISLLLFVYILKDLRLQKRLLIMQSGATYFASPFIYEFVLANSISDLDSFALLVLLTVGIVIKWTSFELYRKIRGEAQVLYPAAFSK